MSGNTFYSTCSAKFKHHKYLENVSFEGTSSFDSILVIHKVYFKLLPPEIQSGSFNLSLFNYVI